jgi:hypothetical protein
MKHAVLLAALLSLVAIDHVRADPPRGAVAYGIFRNGERIGTQRVRFDRTEEGVVVDHRVEIRVRVLGIEVYHYDLTARETWDGGALVGLSATTNRNGTRLYVMANRNDGGLFLRDANGRRRNLPAEAIPADPHWLVPTRPRMQMISAEDGAVRRVRVSRPRDENVRIGERSVRAQRFDVSGDHRATLWYDASGLLVKKSIVASDGSTVVTVLER